MMLLFWISALLIVATPETGIYSREIPTIMDKTTAYLFYYSPKMQEIEKAVKAYVQNRNVETLQKNLEYFEQDYFDNFTTYGCNKSLAYDCAPLFPVEFGRGGFARGIVSFIEKKNITGVQEMEVFPNPYFFFQWENMHLHSNWTLIANGGQPEVCWAVWKRNNETMPKGMHNGFTVRCYN